MFGKTIVFYLKLNSINVMIIIFLVLIAAKHLHKSQILTITDAYTLASDPLCVLNITAADLLLRLLT